ncbi:alpha/beta hydrolase [Paenibacillus sp. SYP-B3998]|nr:alpha/beta hydrolase [Paenibacillus sp. SYP-B3998]
MPISTEYHIIQGGNYAQFGSYGFQKGDLPAAISAKEQRDATMKFLLDWEQQIVNK